MNKIYSLLLKFFLNLIPWLVIGGLYILIRFSGTTNTTDWATSNSSLLTIWIVGAVLISLFFQLGDYLAYIPIFRKKPYGFIISLRVIVVFFGLLLLSLLSRFMAFFFGQIELSEVFPSYIQRLSEIPTLIVFLYLIIMTAVVSFVRQMSFMMGTKVLFNLLIGKYRFPSEEERIFMFLDLKDSTTFAEKLGHIEFSRLIQDCFHDLTASAVKCEVEIYHYVGDEAILTWDLDKGFRNNNCIHIFDEFNKKLSERNQYYVKTYGFCPVFKAGVNMGAVTVAEIGDIKRDIAYLSEVLTTAASIQGACNELNEHLLVSQVVKEHLINDPDIVIHHYENYLLKDLPDAIDLYSINFTKTL